MKLKPLHDHVLLKRKQHEEKTAGGLYIPDTAKEKPIEGEVIAVGPGRLGKNGQYQKLDVKVGDLVLFGKYTGNEVKVDDQEYLLVRESDILGVIQR